MYAIFRAFFRRRGMVHLLVYSAYFLTSQCVLLMIFHFCCEHWCSAVQSEQKEEGRTCWPK